MWLDGQGIIHTDLLMYLRSNGQKFQEMCFIYIFPSNLQNRRSACSTLELHRFLASQIIILMLLSYGGALKMVYAFLRGNLLAFKNSEQSELEAPDPKEYCLFLRKVFSDSFCRLLKYGLSCIQLVIYGLNPFLNRTKKLTEISNYPQTHQAKCRTAWNFCQ